MRRPARSGISRLYNLLLLSGCLGLLCCLGWKGASQMSRVDHYLSHVSPYTTLADWVNIHGQSGLRLKIPKPIYFNVREMIRIISEYYISYNSPGV